MARRKRPRQCARCGRLNKAAERQCVSCGTWLVKRPWRMTKDRIKLVHALARQKGLDEEFYRLRLQRIGVDSCKEMRKADFERFVREVRALPDVG